MKTLSTKVKELKPSSLSIEELSVLTKKNGTQVSFNLIRSILKGNSENISRKRLFSLALALEIPVGYLADDDAITPLDAVIAESKFLCPSDREQLINALSVQQSVLIGQ